MFALSNEKIRSYLINTHGFIEEDNILVKGNLTVTFTGTSMNATANRGFLVDLLLKLTCPLDVKQFKSYKKIDKLIEKYYDDEYLATTYEIAKYLLETYGDFYYRHKFYDSYEEVNALKNYKKQDRRPITIHSRTGSIAIYLEIQMVNGPIKLVTLNPNGLLTGVNLRNKIITKTGLRELINGLYKKEIKMAKWTVEQNGKVIEICPEQYSDGQYMISSALSGIVGYKDYAPNQWEHKETDLAILLNDGTTLLAKLVKEPQNIEEYLKSLNLGEEFNLRHLISFNTYSIEASGLHVGVIPKSWDLDHQKRALNNVLALYK